MAAATAAAARRLRGVRRLLPAGARRESCELARLAGPVVRTGEGRRDGETGDGDGARQPSRRRGAGPRRWWWWRRAEGGGVTVGGARRGSVTVGGAEVR